MTGFVIHKRSRNAGPVSYQGPTWDNADLRAHWRPQYADRAEAEALARRLGEFNPVGFEVSPAP